MHKGFSLVELSIVLVILGLLTGGILSGQSLIRAAELRAVTTEVQRYAAAAHTFRDKYFSIPGDMQNATRFWGDNNAACADAAITNGTPGTCNGDGDGIMEQVQAANATAETLQFWNQLALAGLIEGTYTGTFNASASVTPGSNIPPSKLSNARWFTLCMPNYVGTATFYALDYRHYLYLTNPTGGAILKPEEAWNIDSKMDDGKPARGKIIASHWNDACAIADDGTHANNDLNASYKLSESGTQCTLFFNNAY